MAAATTENQGHGVTSTTSDHVATNAAPDVCFTPDKSAVIPHDNTVNTALATEHTTPKTQISEGPVVRQGDAIGPPSTSGDGGACGKGVASGTCQEEARVSTGSPNVKAEGAPVARKADPGTSNHDNTVMVVKGGDPAAEEKDLAAQKKLECTLDLQKAPPVPWETITHIVCAHGRFPSTSNKLDVATPCSMKLIGKRINAKVKDAGPHCEKEGEHTEWEVSRKQKGKVDGKQTFHGDTQKLGQGWFGKKPVLGDIVPFGGDTEIGPAGDLKRESTGEKPNTGRNAKGQFDGTEKVTKVSGILGGAAVFKSAKEFWECAKADKEPVEVEIVATACSGQTTFTVRALPGEEVKFKFDEEMFNKIRAVLAVINAIVKGAKYVASVGGGKVDATLHLLEEGFYVEAAVHWVELTKDYPEIPLLKHQVDREWSVQVGVGGSIDVTGSPGLKGRQRSTHEEDGVFGKEGAIGGLGKDAAKGLANLAKFGVKFGMEIVAFINAFLPSVGTLAAKAINFLGASCTAGIDIKFEAGIQAGFLQKAGEGPSITGGISTMFDVYINLKLSWGSSLEISGGCTVHANPSFTLDFPIKKRWFCDLALNLEKGVVSFGFRGVFKLDVWWFKKQEQTIDYVPEWAKCEYGPYTMKPFASLE